jgi:tetratricopeptide (TPR) repeat protein
MGEQKLNMLLALLQNSALCCNKMEDWEGSIAFCSAALECNPKSVKAFYHRSKAYFAQKKFKEASEDAYKAD